MSNDDLTFASAGVAGVHYARCEPCMFGSHYGTPTWHSWAGPEDIEHAKATGQPDPSNKRCACPCVYDEGFCALHAPWPDEDDPGAVSLNAEPCPVCDANEACAFDADGRPLIHAWPNDDEGEL